METPDVKPASLAARLLAAALDERGVEFAIGGALALGYWGEPRGTMDVDITIFLPPDQPTAVARLLQQIGCRLNTTKAIESLLEHSFCRATFADTRIDVFLPSLPFLERHRRVTVPMGDRMVSVWNAEVLAVLKMLFFRDQDLVDVETMMKVQAGKLDRAWVRSQLVEICGPRDLRVAEWDRLCDEVPP